MKIEDKYVQRYIQLKHERTDIAVEIVYPSDWKGLKEEEEKEKEKEK